MTSIVGCSDDSGQDVPSFDNPFLIEAQSRPLTIAHRGGTKYFPENTLLAFDYSYNLGVDVLELDVHITSEGHLVICHDNSVDRTSDQSGMIHQKTYEELLTYNFGYHFRDSDGHYPYRDDPVKIPLMEEVFQQFPDTKMIIEIKSQGSFGKQTAAELLRLIELYQMQDKVVVFSFDHNVMNYYHDRNEINTYTGASIYETLDFIVKAASGDSKNINDRYHILALPIELEGIQLTTDNSVIIETAHAKGISTCYWTINQQDEMRRLIMNGADGIITDRPDLMLELLEEMGY